MFSIFSWFTNKKRSKETLKNRLELVLAYDRAKIPPGKVEALRNDLMEVVKRYFPSGNSQVDIEQDGDKVMLMASVAIDEFSRGGGRGEEGGKDIEQALDKIGPKPDSVTVTEKNESGEVVASISTSTESKETTSESTTKTDKVEETDEEKKV